MTTEQMKALSEDKEFINELLIQDTEEDVKKLFKSRGVELTDEDVEDLKNLTKMCIENKVELPEEILENVSGGASVKKWLGKNWDKLIYVSCALGVSAVGIGAMLYSILKSNPIADKTSKLIDQTSGAIKDFQEAIATLNISTIPATNATLDKFDAAAGNLAEATNKINHPIDSIVDWLKSWWT